MTLTPIEAVQNRLIQSREWKAEWNRKARRLYEIVADVPTGKHTRLSVEETSINPILTNCEIKTGALFRLYRQFTIEVDPPNPALSEFLNRIHRGSYRDAMLVLKDRFVVGFGVLGVGHDPQTGEMVWYRINPIRVYWTPEVGFDESEWHARQFPVNGRNFWEYWDMTTYAVLTDDLEPIHHHENPLGEAPWVYFPAYRVPEIAYPIGEAELIYPQQTLLREVRRAILDHARRGAGMLLVQENSVLDEELYKLAEPGEPYLRVRDLDAIRPLPTPPMNAEWITVETLVKNDLDSQVGISQYLRGESPVVKNIQYATEVAAQVSGQSLRMEIDWMPVQWSLMALSEKTIRLGSVNGDISVSKPEDYRVKTDEERMVEILAAQQANAVGIGDGGGQNIGREG